MSENSGGTSSVCKHCGATLPTAIASFCGNCGKPQQEIKSCIRCNFLLPAKAAFCFECGQNQSEQLQRKPCMLCQTVLPINAQHCIFCSAPQDFGILRTMNLKECNNQQCSILMMPELQICYKCRAPQQVMPVVHNQSQQSGESVPLSPQSGVGTFLGIQQTQSPEVLIQTATPLPSVTPPTNPPLQQSALQLCRIASLTDNEKEQYSTMFAHTTATNSPHYSPSLMDAEEDLSQKLNTSPITSHMTPTSSEPVTPQKALLSSPIKRSSDSNDYTPEGKKKKTDKNISVGTCKETNIFKEKGGAVVRQKLSDTNNETNNSGGSEPLKDPTYEIHGDESNNARSQIPSDDVTEDHKMPKRNEKIIPNPNLSTPDFVNTVSHPNNNQAPIRQSVVQEKDTSSVPSGQENSQAHPHTDVLNREKAEAQRKFIKEKISESYVTSEERGIMTDEERTETQDLNLERKWKQEETEGDLISSSKNIKNSESVNSYTPDTPDPPDLLDNPPSNPPDTHPSNPPDTSPSDPPDTPPSDPQNTRPSDPQNTLPSDPPDSPPSDPPDTSPQNMPLSDPENNPPSDPQNTPLSDPQNISPSDPQNNPPSDPLDTSPLNPQNTPLSDPQNNPPSDPQNTPLSDPQNISPSDPQTNPPSDPPDHSPSDPQNTPPLDPRNTPPSDPQDTPPSDPSPSPDPNISGQREEVPDHLSTPEIDPQTNQQVTQTPEDNVDPKDPNSSTFIAQASDSDSSPMPSPNKQDLKTPVQEVNDTNELHSGPNTTASQPSEVEKHNDEKKTKEIKMKTGDEQKKEKQNSTVQPTKVKDDQGNTSTVDKDKEKRGLLSQKKEMK